MSVRRSPIQPRSTPIIIDTPPQATGEPPSGTLIPETLEKREPEEEPDEDTSMIGTTTSRTQLSLSKSELELDFRVSVFPRASAPISRIDAWMNGFMSRGIN